MNYREQLTHIATILRTRDDAEKAAQAAYSPSCGGAYGHSDAYHGFYACSKYEAAQATLLRALDAARDESWRAFEAAGLEGMGGLYGCHPPAHTRQAAEEYLRCASERGIDLEIDARHYAHRVPNIYGLQPWPAWEPWLCDCGTEHEIPYRSCEHESSVCACRGDCSDPATVTMRRVSGTNGMTDKERGYLALTLRACLPCATDEQRDGIFAPEAQP